MTLEIKNLEQRKKDARDNIYQLEYKKTNLNSELKELKEKKLTIIKEIEDKIKYLIETEEKGKNLQKKNIRNGK